MTQLARVFVALNLILAAGFLFSAATILSLNNDWMKQHETEVVAHETTRDNHVRRLAAVTSERDDFKRQNNQLAEVNGNLKGSSDTQAQQIQSLTSELKAKDTANNEMRQLLDNLQAVADRQGKHVERLEAENKANADDARKAQSAALSARTAQKDEEQKVLDLKNERGALQATVTSQKETIKEKDVMIDFARQKGFIFENVLVMDPVRGSIVNADNETMLAVINKGSKDKVKKGYVLDVVRGQKYIARIVIETVYVNAAAGTIKFLAPGATIQAGDAVTNTLN